MIAAGFRLRTSIGTLIPAQLAAAEPRTGGGLMPDAAAEAAAQEDSEAPLPSAAPPDAFQSISEELSRLSAGTAQADAAGKAITGQLMLLRGRLHELEREADGLREELAAVREGSVDSQEYTTQKERAQLFMTRAVRLERSAETLRGELAQARQEAEANASAAARTAEVLREVGMLQQRNADLDGQLGSLHREIAALRRESAETLGRTVASRQALERAQQIFQGIAEFLAPLARLGLDVTPRLDEGMAQLADALTMLTAIEAHGEDAAPAIAGPMPTSPTSQGAIAEKYRTIFQDNGISAERKIEVFIAALERLRRAMHIPGSAKLVDSLFLTALERATWPRATAAEKRQALIEVKGFAHQIIRIAQLLEAGRNLTAIEQCYSEDDFDGVNYDEEHFLIIPAIVRGKSSIDAREGSTLIEIKSLPLDPEISRLLTAILSGPLPKSGLPVIPDDTSRHPEDQQPPAFLATKMANQLLRYRRLLDQSVGELLELHLTSGIPLAQELVDAIARFFRGRVRLFQYEHLLTEHATPLLPSPVEPLADGAQSLAPPDGSVAPPSLLPPEAEVAPSPPAAAPVVPTTPVAPEDALSRIESPEGERALELDDEIRQHVMTAEFFRRARIGDDFERVDRFIEWLLTETTAANGTLEALSATSPAESMRIFLALYESWEKSSPSTEARIRLPADIPDKRAQDRFNGYLRSINGHTIDWGARVDKETCVSHIRAALAALMHETAAELHPPFKRRIKQLYDDMAIYEPSYIGTGKTADFKPRLREIMKEYLWIEEGRTKAKR